MGLFDLFKQKKAPVAVPAEEKKTRGAKAPGTYTRRVKIENTDLINEDGTSRQKVLSNIYHKKAPFDKVLDIEMAEYQHNGMVAYSITVNGMCVGDASADMTEFITASKDRLLGISAFKVDWTSPLDEALEEETENSDLYDNENFDFYKYREKKIKEKDRVYSAKMKITVRSKQ